MILFRQRQFSEKPSGLKKYKNYDGSKMTKAQQRAAIEEEDSIAAHNAGRYRSKHGWKGAGIGAGVGLATGALLGPKGAKAGFGAYGALAGGTIGGTFGAIHGDEKAKKEGHDRDKRSLRLARRFDDENAKRGIESELEYQRKRDIHDRRKEELDAERNYYMAQMAINSWR